MFKINKNNIVNDYNYFRNKGIESIKNKRFNLAIKYIKTAATIAYQFPFQYCDDYLEDNLYELSKEITKYNKLYPKEEKIVFYDSFGFDNQGLTQHYLRALIFNNLKFLYILESENSHCHKIIEELHSYPNCEILLLKSNLSDLDKINIIANNLEIYNPSKIFLHLSPMSIIGFCAFSTYKNCQRYYINLTDHSFWLGKKCLDYCIEFRTYGLNISLNERNINPNKLIYYQYYPLKNIINDNTNKKDFNIFNDKIKIFSGGSLYKYYGEDNFFFNIIKEIIEKNDNVIFFIFGRGNPKPFLNFIYENNYHEKIHLLGHQPNFSNQIKEADIFLTSFPIGGGLMPLIAATNKIPVVCYTTIDLALNAISDFFNISNDLITYTNLEDYLTRINYLINNKSARKEFGNLISKAILDEYAFNANFISIFEHKKFSFNKEVYNLEKILNLHIDSDNKYLRNYYMIIFRNLKEQIFQHPYYLFISIYIILKYHNDILKIRLVKYYKKLFKL